MKKTLKMLVLFSIFFIAGCTGTIPSSSIDKISLGMSPKEVKNELGNPKLATFSKNKIIENSTPNALSALYLSDLEYTDTYKSETEYANYGEILNELSKNNNNVELYEYLIDNSKKHHFYIYFLDDKVKFFFDYNLEKK